MNCAYVQPSRRPTDGRYGENPEPSATLLPIPGHSGHHPTTLWELYRVHCENWALIPLIHDIRFVEDNWENPTLGAWGSRLKSG